MLPPELSVAQLTGRDDSHLVMLPCGHRLQADAAKAFTLLQRDAAEAGFELAIASSFRSFERQLAIWNGKAGGERPVHDDAGHPVPMATLSPRDQMYAILRYSAIPGTSRHHWGTDLDVFDSAAVPVDYQVQLSPAEVAGGGVFDPLHCWLDERMENGLSRGFYRPYGRDRGGVAPERWHLSFAPASLACASRLGAQILQRCWNEACLDRELLLRDEIERDLAPILERYVMVERGWCPADG
jgi:hypothetical protein